MDDTDLRRVGPHVSKMRLFVRDEIRRLIEEQTSEGGTLAGAEVETVDNSTLSLVVPATFGPGQRYELIVREKR